MKKNSLAKAINKAKMEDPAVDGMLVPATVDWFMGSGHMSQYIDGEGLEIAANLIVEQNRRIEERKQRKTFGCSTSSNCMREQVLNVRLGGKNLKAPDYRLANIFEDGFWRNLRWILVFHRMGILVQYEETGYDGVHNISWTPDCIVDLSKYYGKKYKRVPVEIKGMNTNEFSNFQRRSGVSKWAWSRTMQVHSYMLASGLKHWLIWAEDKNNQEFGEYWMPRDENVINYLESRYLYMRKALSDNKLPAVECEMNESDTQFLQCSRSKDCSKLVKLDYDSLKPMKGKEKMYRNAKKAAV